MPAPQYVKDQADEARKLLNRAKTPAPETTEPVVVEPTTEPEQPQRRAGYVDPTDWETRFKHLRANRDERFGKLETQLHSVQSENENLKQQLVDLQPPVETSGFRMSDEDREMLGETGSDVVEKVAKYVDSRFEKSEADRQEEVKTADQRKTEVFLEELTSLVPSWSQHNKDPQFDRWLAHDSVRKNAFDAAANFRDPKSMAELFNQYLDEREGSQPNPLRDASPDPDVRSTESTGDVFEEWWSAAEISAHFAESTKLKRLGKTSGPAWEVVKERQARIDDAIRHNRIQP